MAPIYGCPEEMITIDDSDVENTDTDMSDVCEEEDENLARAIQASFDVPPENSPSPMSSKPSFTNPQTKRNGTRQRRASSSVHEVLESCVSFLGEHIVPGDTVELQYGQERLADAKYLPSGDFLRVYEIQKHWSEGGKIKLKGIIFRRTKYMKTVFTRRMNEVCMCLGPDTALTSNTLRRGMVTRPIEEVVKKRRLCLTNEDLPAHSFRTCADAQGRGKPEIFYDHNLVCRWAYLGEDYISGKPHWLSEMVFTRLTQDLCRPIRHPEDIFVSVQTLRQSNRGLSHSTQAKQACRDVIAQFVDSMARVGPSASLQAGCDQAHAIDVDAEAIAEDYSPLIIDNEIDTSISVQSSYHPTMSDQTSRSCAYTLGDFFSCGGGWSQSAKMARLHIKLAVDQDPHCTVIYQNNHPDVDVYPETIANILERFSGRWPKIDIILLSPPCQPYSPAKRGEGKNDEANIAALFSVHHLIKDIQPRVAILEQTYGLSTWKKHRVFYHALLGMFTANGYSVRSKNVLLANYGCYQMRKRLVCIATRAGEILPQFPPPTHDIFGANGLQRWRTKDYFLPAIANIEPGPFHPYGKGERPSGRYAQLDTLLPTITTENKIEHPSGTRDLTLPELSIAQGFPDDYNWYDPQVSWKKARAMVGNAVPPNAFAPLLDHIRTHLEKTDAEEAAFSEEH